MHISIVNVFMCSVLLYVRMYHIEVKFEWVKVLEILQLQNKPQKFPH